MSQQPRPELLNDPTIALACDLIRAQSVTPEDAGCQAMMTARLEALGFKCTHLRFDDVDNLWAVYGESGPILAFAGHTDVVPTGNIEDWQSPPFEATIKGDLLYGRGAADMKGSLAAMVTACERFLAEPKKIKGRIAFLITSDEEGIAKNGTVKVIEWLESRNEKIEWCLVGEPSSSKVMGDVVKNGRRGSLGCELKVKGIQGHIAYPQLADNPIHKCAPALAELSSTTWDEGNDFFPATSFQVSNINGGTGATNVIPGSVDIVFNFRFSTELSAEQLIEKTEAILNKHALEFSANWHLSGNPFLTATGKLLDAAQSAIKKVCNIDTELSTSGGTSDGRFIAPTGAQVLELGPINATIHQVNECVSCKDLIALSQVYTEIMINIFDQ